MDFVIVWCYNTETKNINAFLVETTTPGYEAEIMLQKVGARSMQNADIKLNNVKVHESQRLKIDGNFRDTVETIFIPSRLLVAWVATGLTVGCYDHIIDYMHERKQFGASIDSFQLGQERLSRIMGGIQAMLLMCYRVTQLAVEGKATVGVVSLLKAWTTKQAKEIASLARECIGGHGILYQSFVMKAMMDLEAVDCVEGTYDINALICGKDLTGISAFRPAKPRKKRRRKKQ